MHIIPRDGGPRNTLIDVRNPHDALWLDDGRIVFADNENGALFSVVPESRETEMLTSGVFGNPARLPNGTHFLVVNQGIGIGTIDTHSGEFALVGVSGNRGALTNPTYLSSGHLLYGDGTSLKAVQFDLDNLEAIGNAETVLSDLRIEALAFVSQYVVSESGTLIYIPDGDGRMGHLVSFRPGESDQLISTEPQRFGEMSLSPDATTLAIAIYTNNWNIWLYDLTSGAPPSRFTFAGLNYNPVWNATSDTLLYTSTTNQVSTLLKRPADMSSEASPVQIPGVANPGIKFRPAALSYDSASLFASLGSPPDIVLYSFTDSTKHTPVLASQYDTWAVSVSPTSGQIAFNSDESGKMEVFVQDYPTSERRAQVSSGGGMDPKWSADGRHIYYHNVREIFKVSTDDLFSRGRPVQELIHEGFYIDLGGVGWAVDSRTERFFMVRTTDEIFTAGSARVISNIEQLVESLFD